MSEENSTPRRSKGFVSVFSKTVKRTKEKVLQNLGKADKTTDDVFNDHVHRLNEQSFVSNNILKEIKRMALAAAAMSDASKSISTEISSSFDESWNRRAEMDDHIKHNALLWGDYLMQLNNDVLSMSSEYNNVFQPMKLKIAKRGRKLVDYDSSRHNFESHISAKKKDEVKIAKAQDEMENARSIYNTLNTELNEELPQLYESRVFYLMKIFNEFFKCEAKFHDELAKIRYQVEDMTSTLMIKNSKEVFDLKRVHSISHRDEAVVYPSTAVVSAPAPPPPSTSPAVVVPVVNADDTTPNTTTGQTAKFYPDGDRPYIDQLDDQSSQHSSKEGSTKVEKQSSFVIKRAINNDVSPTSKSPSDSRSSSVVVPDKGGETAPKSRPTSITLSSTPPPDVSAAPSVPCTPPPKDDRSPSLEKKETTPTVEDNDTATPPMMSRLSNGVKKEVPLAKEEQIVYDIPKEHVTTSPRIITEPEYEPIDIAIQKSKESETDTDTKSKQKLKILFKVRSTHPYVGEDADELSFEKGEIINVIPFEDAEDEDEGWLNGIIESSNTKGVFPRNFTENI